ncbi:MAG TPA: ArsR family transcriptional regulator [Hadesarchaea archaeon]|nr:ArsR family transcriptional regulator [Hadesarchaea archaeon]
MLESIIGSKTRVKILALFLLNLDRRFYVRELARKTGGNINSVRRELQKLESIGLLKSERAGNLKYFTTNKKMPIYEELKSMFLKTEGLGKIMKENLSELGEVKLAFVYGSFARGEEQLKSDIDLMIVGEVDEKRLVPMIRKLEERLSREINYTLFSSMEFKSRVKKKDPFLSDVLRGKKIKLVGEPNEV